MPHLSSMNLEPGATPSAQYITPYGGVLRVRPIHALLPHELYDGQNLCIRHGELRSRAGLSTQIIHGIKQQLSGIPLAGITFVGADLKAPTVMTTDSVWQFREPNWINLGGMPGVTRDAQGSFTTLEANEQVYLIANDSVHPLHWWSASQPFSQIPQNGNVATPIFKDIATASNRIIGIQEPYTVKWSQFLAPDQWRDSNIAILADTEDEVIAVRSMGTLGFVVYKAGSIFVGFAQAGSDSNAFRFEHFGNYDGPANNQSIVSVSGVDFYMTASGRIGAFDGSNQTWIADGIWPFIANELDPLYITRIRSTYSYLHNELTFYYPRLHDNGVCHGVITINLPYPTQGIQQPASFNGYTHLDITTTLSIRYFQGDRNPWVFDSSGYIYKSNGEAYTDDNMPFPCTYQPGLHQPPPQQDSIMSIYRALFEVFALRDDTRGLVEVYEVHAGLLQQPGGVVEDKSLILDLSRFTSSNQYFGFLSSDSFFGVKFEWPSDSRVHLYGVNFYTRPVA